MLRPFTLCALCLAGAAHASGLYLGDNGAKAMIQAGAFAAQADDLTAIQHNPAGLAHQAGFNFLADLQVLRHDVRFSRQDPGFDWANPANDSNTVRSADEPFLLPFFAVGYGFPVLGRTFTIAAGLYAPPGQGRYEYPAPNYTKDDLGNDVERPNTFSPQRYALDRSDFFIAFPTLSAAWDLHPRFKVGLSAQLVVSRFQLSQTLYAGDEQGQLQEDPSRDATVSVDLAGQVGFTGILGVLWRPTNWLSIGGSLRPPVPIKARGKLTVVPATPGLTVTGDRATLSMTLPLEVSFGTRMMPLEGGWKDRLAFNIDLVFQAWNSIDQLMVTPENVTTSSGTGGEERPLPAFGQNRKWVPTLSVRLGTYFRIHQRVSVCFGTAYESSAVPKSSWAPDFSHPARFIFTGGATLHISPFEVIAGAMFTPTDTTIVTDSTAMRGQLNADFTSAPVGNGIYTSDAWGLIFGFRIHIGEVERTKTLDDTSPPPVQAPMPANPEKLPVEPTT
ncbi:MAG: outer membrane protein transport protein [Archangium sp.]|nr:outer membrane protein transport protein [Archangium sp.]